MVRNGKDVISRAENMIRRRVARNQAKALKEHEGLQPLLNRLERLEKNNTEEMERDLFAFID